jgi:hypothetical protein
LLSTASSRNPRPVLPPFNTAVVRIGWECRRAVLHSSNPLSRLSSRFDGVRRRVHRIFDDAEMLVELPKVRITGEYAGLLCENDLLDADSAV